jgi:hypothetical protein
MNMNSFSSRPHASARNLRGSQGGGAAGVGVTLLRLWLVFNGVWIDLLALGLLPILAPDVAASIPFPNFKDLFPGIAIDSFSTRAVAYGFLLHGVIRTAAGILGSSSPTMGCLAAVSYMVEFYMLSTEFLVHGTLADPSLIAGVPVLAALCAYCLCFGKAKTA